MMHTHRDISQIVAPLSGTAAQILLVFFLAVRDQSFTNDELATILGKSKNTITAGLKKLSLHGFLQYNGKQHGWSLQSTYRQLSFDEHETEISAKNLDHDPELGAKNLDHREVRRKKFGSTPPIVVSSSTKDQEKETTTTSYRADGRKKFGSSAANDNHQGEITPTPPAEITARSGSPEITAVARWLQKAGINPDSGVWAEITSQALDPKYVKSHVLELLAAEAGIPGADENLQTGGLIYRLRHQWRAPPMRCEECLRTERECQCADGYWRQIPEEYRDIVRR
jgi:hypothetical protein